MRNPLYLKLFTGLLVIGISLACGIPFTQIEQPETETPFPMPTVRPTKTETPTFEPTLSSVNFATPTEFVVLNTATPKFAPFCQPSSASVLEPTPSQCRMPIAEQSSIFCSNKVPYNLIMINVNSTYETLSDDVTCSDAGVKDGKRMLTCTGPMALPFELKVCDQACAIPTFQAGTTHCPQDFNFNETLRCCEQEPQPAGQECVVLKLQTKSCVVDCSEYTSETTCGKNAYACTWNTELNLCQLRK